MITLDLFIIWTLSVLSFGCFDQKLKLYLCTRVWFCKNLLAEYIIKRNREKMCYECKWRLAFLFQMDLRSLKHLYNCVCLNAAYILPVCFVVSYCWLCSGYNQCTNYRPWNCPWKSVSMLNVWFLVHNLVNEICLIFNVSLILMSQPEQSHKVHAKEIRHVLRKR